MPFLDWVNKNQAKDTPREVPYHLLKREATYGDATAAADNLIIQGDNLLALKALIPFYAGRVKCIFIDPPYNTKSAFEHYDDNLEHSQWLSMMYPRLVLLRELLAEDGSIWVTIDDNEAHYLKVLMDEVFGRRNFVANVVWQKKYAVANDHKTIAPMHDHMLVFRKSPAWQRNLLEREAAKDKLYKYSDERGEWRADNYTCSKTAEERPNLYYPIIHPKTGAEIWPKRTRVWAFSKEQHLKHVANDMIYWGKDGMSSVPSIKRYKHLLRQTGIVPQTLWTHDFAGHTDQSRKETRAVLETESLADDFLTPKPELLLSRVIEISSAPNDIILDSFLGSGTTAAVAQKMRRRYIGIEMGEHARTHCVPRLEKVIAGEQGGISQAVGWQGGGGFSFHTLGEPAFDEHGRLNATVKFPTLAAYVWHVETGSPGQQVFDSPLLGIKDGIAYFLLYNGILGDRRPAGGNVLTSAILSHIRTLCPAPTPVVVYGESARLGPARMAAEGVTFKQIPYDVSMR